MKILTAGVSVRAMAESAAKSGYPVVALDAFGDFDLRSFCEGYSLARDFQVFYSANGLLRASRTLEFDALAYTANLENFPGVVKNFSRSAIVLGNGAEVLERVRNWPALSAFLGQAGFKTPAALYEGDPLPIPGDGRWLKKPLRSGGGRHVSFWSPGRRVGKNFLLQEFLPGFACSASFVANGREAMVIGLTEQLIGLPDYGGHRFWYCGNLLPLGAELCGSSFQDILVQAQRMASLLTREFSLTGVNGIDFILMGDQVCPIEVNPRYGASMELIEQAYGLPIFDLHFRAVTAGELPQFDLSSRKAPPERYFAKTILYAEKDAIAPDTSGWMERRIRDIPHPGERLVKGQPICTLYAEGGSREECLANLAGAREALKREIYGG
ncbi:MAG: ATP-grasp domain-containing protein [Anaerolineae bacterium]|nr:ATP-grasp domain-containing protein [Anaerolineae bacterium]